MAQPSTPAPIGTRLARLRAERGLSAKELADRLEGSGITRTVITNVETGRKRDLTATEVLQLATGLEVNVWALLVDTSSPFAALGIPGLYNVPEDETVAEMVANRWGDAFGSEVGDIPVAVRDMGSHASKTLVALRRFTQRVTELTRAEKGFAEPPPGPEDIYVPDGTIADEPHLEPARHQFRDALEHVTLALSARAWLRQSDDPRLSNIPERAERYLETLRDIVTELARFYEDKMAVSTLETIDAMRIPDVFFTNVRITDISNGFEDGTP